MSGHGQREAALLVDAVNWKDRVIDDVRSEQGRLSAREHQVSFELISAAAILVASYTSRINGLLALALDPRQLLVLADPRAAGAVPAKRQSAG